MRFKAREMPARPAFTIGRPGKPPDLAMPVSDLRLAIINLLPEHPFDFPPFQHLAELAAAPGLPDRLLRALGVRQLVLCAPRSERALLTALASAGRLAACHPEYPVTDERLARLARTGVEPFRRLDWFDFYSLLLAMAGEPLSGLPVSVSFPSAHKYFRGTAEARSTLERVLAALPDAPDWCRADTCLCIDHPFRGTLAPLDRVLDRTGPHSFVLLPKNEREAVPLRELLALMVHEPRYKTFRGYSHSLPTLLGTPCQKCLHCVDICPVHIVPFMIAALFGREQIREAVEFKPGTCIECGLCSSVCPSGIPLLHAIRTLKKKAGIS